MAPRSGALYGRPPGWHRLWFGSLLPPTNLMRPRFAAANTLANLVRELASGLGLEAERSEGWPPLRVAPFFGAFGVAMARKLVPFWPVGLGGQQKVGSALRKAACQGTKKALRAADLRRSHSVGHIRPATAAAWQARRAWCGCQALARGSKAQALVPWQRRRRFFFTPIGLSSLKAAAKSRARSVAS